MCSECKWVESIKKLKKIGINHSTKCTYILIPKCASSYILQNIADQGYKFMNITPENYHRRYSDYFTWTFTRDPLTRFIASFCELKYERDMSCLWRHVNKDNFNPSIFLDKLESIGEFDPHSISQINLIRPFETRRKLDYIGNLENMGQCCKDIEELTGVKLGKSSNYKRITPTERKPTLTESEINRVKELYTDDFNRFGIN